MDALCHVSYKGDFYNGVKRRDVTSEGCPRLGIDAVSGGVFTRGVLIDMAWLKGVDYLEPGTPVTLYDLVAWEEKTGVVVQPGDAVLLRTGRWTRRAREGPWGGRFAGFHASCIPWLKERDIAILGTDAGLDVMPSVIEGGHLADPHVHAGCPRRERSRRRRLRAALRGGAETEPVGVPAHLRADAGRWRHGIAAQSDRDLLRERFVVDRERMGVRG